MTNNSHNLFNAINAIVVTGKDFSFSHLIKVGAAIAFVLVSLSVSALASKFIQSKASKIPWRPKYHGVQDTI